jgi:bifunctional DNA-binding transcriptional regulator/antitoxin component of YhaV-PrlF toxin-antitoxin module
MGQNECKYSGMSATAIGEKSQTTLPAEVSEAAGLRPGDKVDWRFEDGEIRGRKVPEKLRVIKGKLVMRDGQLVLDTTGLTIDLEDIAKAVREERDSRA